MKQETLTLKRVKLMEIYNGLSAIDKATIKNKKFSYIVLKNIKSIQSEIDIMRDMYKHLVENPTQKEYENAKKDIALKYCTKDDEGNPIINKESGLETVSFIGENSTLFHNESDELEAKYKEHTDWFAKESKALDDFYETEIDFEFTKIDFDDVPEDFNVESIFDLIYFKE